MLTPITTRKMVMRPKKMMVWTSIAIPLVCMFPNSTTLLLPGNWNSDPGLNSTNSTTAITTGPSLPSFFLDFFLERAQTAALISNSSLIWEGRRYVQGWSRTDLWLVVLLHRGRRKRIYKKKQRKGVSIKTKKSNSSNKLYAPMSHSGQMLKQCTWQVY